MLTQQASDVQSLGSAAPLLSMGAHNQLLRAFSGSTAPLQKCAAEGVLVHSSTIHLSAQHSRPNHTRAFACIATTSTTCNRRARYNLLTIVRSLQAAAACASSTPAPKVQHGARAAGNFHHHRSCKQPTSAAHCQALNVCSRHGWHAMHPPCERQGCHARAGPGWCQHLPLRQPIHSCTKERNNCKLRLTLLLATCFFS